MTRRDSLRLFGAAFGIGGLGGSIAAGWDGADPAFGEPGGRRDWGVQRRVQTQATLSRDGRLLATRSWPWAGEPPGAPQADVICFWDVASRAVIRELGGLLKTFGLGTFSPDAARFCVVYPTRAVAPAAAGHPGGTATAPQGGYGGHRQTIWDFESGRKILEFPVDDRDSPGAGRFTGDGTELVGLSHDYQLVIRRADDGCIVLRADGRALDGVTSRVKRSAFSADARRVATLNGPVRAEDHAGDFMAEIRAWDVARGIIRRFRGEPRAEPGSPPIATLVSVAITPDGSRVIAGRYDHLLTVWDFETGEVLRTFRPEGDSRPESLAVSPDGALLVSADDRSTARVWDLGTGRLIEVIALEAGGDLRDLAFLPGKLRLVTQGEFRNALEPGTGTGPGTGRIERDPETGRVILTGTPMAIQDVELTRD